MRTWERWAVYFGLKDPDPPPDPGEIRASARTLLRSPLWWLVVLCVAVGAGAAYEAFAAALGDGRLDPGAIPRVAVPVILVSVGVQVFEALRRPG